MPSRHPSPEHRALVALIEERAAAVGRLEDRAAEAVRGEPDQAEYERLMRAKAELLADLEPDAAPLLDRMQGAGREPGPGPRDVSARLAGFSHSASMALEIGSVFFMSALLFPEDHAPGEPNDLERLVLDLGGRVPNDPGNHRPDGVE